MTLPKRLQLLLGYLSPCEKFSDVGCDHGYIAKAMLDGGLCNSAVVSDVSAKSLEKAKLLLADYIPSRVKAVVCDGLSGVDKDCDQVLIAGMGGEEIVKILTSSPFFPKKLVLQPMKNAKKLRLKLLELGYGITCDTLFYDGQKFYFVMSATLGEDCKPYTELELEYGRDSLNGNKTFIDFLEDKISRLKLRISGKNGEVQNKIDALEGLKNEIKRSI